MSDLTLEHAHSDGKSVNCGLAVLDFPRLIPEIMILSADQKECSTKTVSLGLSAFPCGRINIPCKTHAFYNLAIVISSILGFRCTLLYFLSYTTLSFWPGIAAIFQVTSVLFFIAKNASATTQLDSRNVIHSFFLSEFVL